MFRPRFSRKSDAIHQLASMRPPSPHQMTVPPCLPVRLFQGTSGFSLHCSSQYSPTRCISNGAHPNDHVIQTLSAQGTDDPLCKWILPRCISRGRGCFSVRTASCCRSARFSITRSRRVRNAAHSVQTQIPSHLNMTQRLTQPSQKS